MLVDHAASSVQKYISCIAELATCLLVSNDRHLERFPPTDEPVRQCAKHHGPEYWSCVVHVVSGNRQYLGKWHPDDNKDQVAQRENVNGQPNSAKLEWAVWRRWASDFAQQHEENGQEVGYVEGEGLQRDERVERRRAGDVDE